MRRTLCVSDVDLAYGTLEDVEMLLPSSLQDIVIVHRPR